MAVPTLTKLDVEEGDVGGGSTVHATGTGFTGTTGATVGGVAATGVVIVSDTRLTFVTPAHAVGATSIIVSNADGPSVGGADTFTYIAEAYTQTQGDPVADDGTNYFMDVPLNYANVMNGTLQERFDTWQYPEVGVQQPPKLGIN